MSNAFSCMKALSMFDNFPKIREPLQKEIADIYESHYKANREGQTSASSLAQKMETWLHRQVARDVSGPESAGKRTLELGAGTLNHLQYEPAIRAYDIVEPFTELYKNASPLARIRHIHADIADIPPENRYDRIISIATLEHVCNLPEMIARSGLLLAEQGVFRASIPNEGEWLWTLAWKMTTGLEFRWRYGLDYGLLMRYEHVNTANEIEAVLRHFFGKTQCRVLGLCKSASLYRYYECHQPKIEKCVEYLDFSTQRQGEKS